VAAKINLLTDEIDKLSGVRIRRSGSVGDPSQIAINGITGSGVRIFVDGIPMEFMYPGFDIASLPLTDIARVDVYKGVLPAELSVDALGGAINIVTSPKNESGLQASYSLGSFNTHYVNAALTLVSKSKSFVNLNIGRNTSDNDYSHKADVLSIDPVSGFPSVLKDQKVKRFHDFYKMTNVGLSLGVSQKKWADNMSISASFFDMYKAYQNGLLLKERAVGEADGANQNVSFTGKYNHKFFKERLKVSLMANYSIENSKWKDTTSIYYNWLGGVVPVPSKSQGEFNEGNPYLLQYKSNNTVIRATFAYAFNYFNSLTFSVISASKKRNAKDFDIEDPSIFDRVPEQYLQKNIFSMQYDGRFLEEKLTFSTALKKYNYELKGMSDFSDIQIRQQRSFNRWNASAKYKLSDSFYLRSSYERGFLIPEVYQFAGNASGITANGELLPEESDNINIGFIYGVDLDNTTFNWTVSAFSRAHKNLIYLRTDSNPLKYDNAENIDSNGLETSLTTRFSKSTSCTINVSYLNKIYKSFLRESSQNDFLVGSPFPNTPNFFYNIELNHLKKNVFNSNMHIKTYLNFHHVASFNHMLVGAMNSIETTPDSYVPVQYRFDLGVSLVLNPSLSCAVNAYNIFDSELFDIYSIPKPGRNFNVKLIYKSNSI